MNADLVGANLVFAQEDKALRRGESCIRPDIRIRPTGTLPGTLGRIMQAFKSLTTHEYTIGVKQRGWPPFPGKLWQRDYHDHIIRGDKDLNALREYIVNNALKWNLDEENPFR